MTSPERARHLAAAPPPPPPEPLGKAEAQAVTDRIRTALPVLAELVVDVARAFTGRAWLPLGYPDWATYCRSELVASPRLRLSREQRIDVVRRLAEMAGMSNRQIAAAGFGPRETVRRDLAAVPDTYVSPRAWWRSPRRPLDVAGLDDDARTWLADRAGDAAATVAALRATYSALGVDLDTTPPTTQPPAAPSPPDTPSGDPDGSPTAPADNTGWR